MKKCKSYLIRILNGKVNALRVPVSCYPRIYRRSRQVTNTRNRRITRYLKKANR